MMTLSMRDHIEGIMKRDRAKQLEASGQLSLGELIESCAKLLSKFADEIVLLETSEGRYHPLEMHSWRGIYKEIAIEPGDGSMNLAEFTEMLGSSVGATFTGWKGGEFVMDTTTPVWVSSFGDSANNAVVNVSQWDGFVYVETIVCEPYPEIMGE